jgi:hypothetical protein
MRHQSEPCPGWVSRCYSETEDIDGMQKVDLLEGTYTGRQIYWKVDLLEDLNLRFITMSNMTCQVNLTSFANQCNLILV